MSTHLVQYYLYGDDFTDVTLMVLLTAIEAGKLGVVFLAQLVHTSVLERHFPMILEIARDLR